MSGTALACAMSAGVCAVASPYSARLIDTVPDLENKTWWTGAPPTRRRLIATVVVGLVFGALAGTAAGGHATLAAFIALALVSTPLAIIDVELHRLPDRLMIAAAGAAAVLLAVAAAVEGDWSKYLRSIEGAAAVGAVFFAIAFIAPSAFGFGDVKLGAVLGAYLGWFGWSWVYYGIFGGFVLGSLVGIALMVVGRAGRKTAIPFGPMLIAGALGVLALHATTSILS